MRVLRKGRLLLGKISVDPEFNTATTFSILVEESEKNRARIICSPKNCGTVEPAEIAEDIPSRQRGLKIVENPRFAGQVLRDVPVENLCLGSRLDYVVVGVRSKVLGEADYELLCREAGGEWEVGLLSDVLRLKEGARDFRGLIISTATKEPTVPRENPHLVLFDGASAFLKLHHRFPRSHAVVLLDRSEPHFLEAANVLNSQFATRADDLPSEFTEGSPIGVEGLAFQSLTHD